MCEIDGDGLLKQVGHLGLGQPDRLVHFRRQQNLWRKDNHQSPSLGYGSKDPEGEGQAMDGSLPFEEYSRTSGQTWPAIAQARAESRAVHQTLKQSLGQFEDGDVNVVLFGSIARQEWTSGSDVDWTLLVDGIANAGHYKTAQLIQSTLSELEHDGRRLAEPGKSGVVRG